MWDRHVTNSVAILMCITTELNGLTLYVHYILVVYVTYVQYVLDSKSYRFTITAYSVTNQRYFYSTQGRRTAAPLRGAGINVRIVVYCTSILIVCHGLDAAQWHAVCEDEGQYRVTTNPGIPYGYSE